MRSDDHCRGAIVAAVTIKTNFMTRRLVAAKKNQRLKVFLMWDDKGLLQQRINEGPCPTLGLRSEMGATLFCISLGCLLVQNGSLRGSLFSYHWLGS